MTPTEAKTEVFLTAFYSLPHVEQEMFIAKLFKAKEFREDLIDLAMAETRKKEKTRSFNKVVGEIKDQKVKC